MVDINNVAIIIPSRMGSSRFYGKPLVNIAGKMMIERVYEIAKQTKCPNIFIATDSAEIAQAVNNFGAKAIMTSSDHPSGTDRIYEALTKIDNGNKFEIIINLQGDMPFFDFNILFDLLNLFEHADTEIATLAALITNEHDANNPNIVKIVSGLTGDGSSAKALYFTRDKSPHGEGDYYHHIGIYGFRRSALEQFVNLKPSTLEQREKLEQLRALENNMTIRVACVKSNPQGVDMPQDVKKVEKLILNK